MLPTTDVPRRRRRYHSPEFKSQVVTACQAPGISVAAIAQKNQLNANLVRRWIKAAAEAEAGAGVMRVGTADNPSSAAAPAATLPATFVPVRVADPEAPIASSSAVASPIRIELRRLALEMNITWPATQAEACAHWLRELLR
jgi:transposase